MSQYKDIMKQKAAALRYDPENHDAPVVVASGMGYIAEKITETAMKAGVPVYEDTSLASLLTQLKLGTEIPEELYRSIVEIYVYFLGFTADGKREAEEPQKKNVQQPPASSVKKTDKEARRTAQEREPSVRRAQLPERMSSSGYRSRERRHK